MAENRKPLTRREFACAAGAFVPPLMQAAAAPSRAYPNLAAAGGNYAFAIIADPHIRNDSAPTSEVLARTVQELNAMNPAPAFVVINGDLVGSGQEEQFAAFTRIIKKMRPQPVLVHGNHDGKAPVNNYLACLKSFQGPGSPYFSFDAGQWHFVALHAAIEEAEFPAVLAWLDADLKANRARPTMVFLHYHLLPAGLTQLEFYTYAMPERLRILDTVVRYGNVRYVFCGHVHNGIQTAVKTAWSYKGANFIICPTGVAPRPFGDEYAPFTGGVEQGGYYMVGHVKGREVTLTGRLNGVSEAHTFPRTFREFKPEMEPRWFHSSAEFAPAPSLANGGFDNGLTGWRAPYRYIADHTPGFIWNASGKPHSGKGSAYLCSHVLGKKWAADELIELYQLVQATPGASPVLRGAYYIEESNAFSGGYIRVVAYRQKEMIAMMLFDWGKGKEKCKHLPRSFAFTATGARAEHRCLISLGKQRKAMFWNLPADKGTWHSVNLDIRGLYEQALKTQGIESAFGADKLFLAVGVWNGRGGAENSAARFDDLALVFSKERESSILDGKQLLTGAQVFETTYALDKSADE